MGDSTIDSSPHPDRELALTMAQCRPRLRRMVAMRLDKRVQQRVDPSDVIQEAYTEAANRFHEFEQQEGCSLFVWLRFLTLQKVAQTHRLHIGAQKRSVLGEAQANRRFDASASSAMLAHEFLANEPAPYEKALNNERLKTIHELIDSMSELDREILAMRHFEMLSNTEVAAFLDIPEDTAYRRYIRALARLRKSLQGLNFDSSSERIE